MTSKLSKALVVLLIATTSLACQAEHHGDDSAHKHAAPSVDSSKYTSLPNPINVSGDKIEVAELFWYGCGHCFALEPHVEAWKKTLADNVVFVKVPAVFSSRWEFHAKAFYTMEILGVLDQANEAFFHRIHVARKPVSTLSQLSDFLEGYGQTSKQVESAFNSFAVDSKLRNAKKITMQSTARGVPAMLVDGKYHTSAQLAGGQDKIFDVVDQLVVKAAAER